MKSSKKNDEEVLRKLKEIGEKVRSIRKQQYKNYEDFAKAFKINKVTISRLENGENTTLMTFIEVLSALNVTLEEFFAEFKP